MQEEQHQEKCFVNGKTYKKSQVKQFVKIQKKRGKDKKKIKDEIVIIESQNKHLPASI
jgi:hypothetical protein